MNLTSKILFSFFEIVFFFFPKLVVVLQLGKVKEIMHTLKYGLWIGIKGCPQCMHLKKLRHEF